MNRSLLLLVLSVSIAAPAAAASCDQPAVDALLAEVTTAKATAPLIDSFEAPSYDESRARCAKAEQKRAMSGKPEEEHLICVSHPTVQGGVDVRRPFGAPIAIFKSITTDLKVLKPEAAQGLCDRINACLYERYDQPKSASVLRLSAAWDGLSCVGE